MIQQPELGKKIADLRKAKGLTQEELVEKCNLNVRTLQRIESGEATPITYTLRLIFEALDYSYDKQDVKGLLLKRLEQFYISFIDLFNLKTNTMKKISILTVMTTAVFFGLFFLISGISAQNNEKIIIDKGQFKIKENEYSISPKVYYLYNWALNPINVELPEGALLTSNNGKIKKLNNEIFIIPNKEGKGGELIVTATFNDSSFTQSFTVIPLPSPMLTIGGEILKFNSKTNFKKIYADKYIKLYFTNGLKTEFDIIEFTIYYNQGQPDEKRFEISGNRISTHYLGIIRQGLEVEKEVILDDITVIMPDGFAREYGKIYFVD